MRCDPLISRFQILIAANNPREVANDAWLKLCRLDVNEEIAKWGRQRTSSRSTCPRATSLIGVASAPHFSADGKVALVRVATGFQGMTESLLVRPDLTEILPSPSGRCHQMGRFFAQSKDTGNGHVRKHGLQSGPGNGVVLLSVVVCAEGAARGRTS
jgi:hypothetical protein